MIFIGILQLIFLFLLAFIPCVIWLNFYLKKDEEAEPRYFLILTFSFGAFITLLVSPIENQWLKPYVQENPNREIATLLFIFLYPFIEEFFKFFAARLSTLKNRFFGDEATDPMIYLITAGLGFAMAENLLVLFRMIFERISFLPLADILTTPLPFVLITDLFIVIIIRFLATVFLHSLSAGLLGYFWGISRVEKNFFLKIFGFLFGLIFASLLHSAFNYLIIRIDVSGDFLSFISLVLLLVFFGKLIGRLFNKLASFNQKKGA